MVEVGLLGPLVVTSDDGPVVIGAAKERAVLEMLALAAGRTVTADALVDGLWGDDPPATAVKTLQNYVARLRRVLPDGLIRSAPGGYALALGPEAVDAHRFAIAVDSGRHALADRRFCAAADAFDGALALWRGHPTPDLADQPGGLIEVTRLEELRRSAEDDLAEARLAFDRPADLVADLEAAVGREPLRERRWAQLMLALYRCGRQADALRAYQRARTTLIDGLGIEPGAELRDLERAIIAQDATLDATAVLPPEPSTRAGLAPAVTALTTSEIIGRDRELAVLATRWAQARRGTARVVVITGEPGIGKSRLLGEAARVAHRDGGLVLFGRCDAEPIAPYQPFVEAIRWYSTTTPIGVLRHALGWSSTELSRLVPELARRLAVNPPLPPTDAAARHRLFDAVVAVLAGRADERPLLVALDDFQWSDPDSTVLLRHLLRALSSTRLMVVLAHRSREDATDARLEAVISGLPAECAPTTLALSGLTTAAISELIESDDHERVAAVQRASGGSPLFLQAITAHLRTTGRLPEPDDLPATVRQAVAQRLTPLGRETRRLIAAAAVAGGSFELAVVADAAGLDVTDAVDFADQARRANVVDEDPSRPGCFTFTHDVVRTVVYDEMLLSRRVQLHRAIGDATFHRHGGDADAHAATLAHHYVAAACGRPDPVAAHWSLIAGRRAAAQLAWEAAAAHLADAVRLDPVQGGRARFTATVERAAALRASGSSTAAKTQFFAALDLAEAADEPTWYAEAALRWAEIPVDVRRELHQVIDLLRRARDDIASTDSVLHARLLGRLAFSLAWANDPAARATSDEAIAMARRIGDPATLGKAIVWSVPTRVPLEFAADPSPLIELDELARTVDDPDVRFGAAYLRVVRAVQRAERTEIVAAVAGLRTLAESLRLPDYHYRALKAEADWWLIQGRTAEVEARVDEMLRDAARSDLRNAVLFAGAVVYDLRRWQGRLGELAPWFDAVAARGERIALVPAMHVQVLIAAGRPDEAKATLDTFLATDFADLWPVEQAHSFVTLATAAATLHHHDAAAAIYERLLPWAGLICYDGDGGILGAIDHHLGVLAATLGRDDTALNHLTEAHLLHTALAAPPLEAMTEHVASKIRLAQHDVAT